MKPRAFAYRQVESVDEAFALLSEYGEDAKIIAGGQSLVPMMNMRLVSPALLIDVDRVAALRGIDASAGTIRIGAMTRHADIEESSLVRKLAPLLSRAVRFVAHRAVRNRGTFGGSLCHADPAAEFPACALLLDATMNVGSARGQRTIAARDFFLGSFATALAPDEVLLDVDIPVSPPGMLFAFDELSRRQGDFAMAGIAAASQSEGIAVGMKWVGFGCADRPIRLTHVEGVFGGDSATAASPQIIRDALDADLAPHLSGTDRPFRVALLQALVTRQRDAFGRMAA